MYCRVQWFSHFLRYQTGSPLKPCSEGVLWRKFQKKFFFRKSSLGKSAISKMAAILTVFRNFRLSQSRYLQKKISTPRFSYPGNSLWPFEMLLRVKIAPYSDFWGLKCRFRVFSLKIGHFCIFNAEFEWEIMFSEVS